MNKDEVIEFFESRRRAALPAWHVYACIWFVLSGPVTLGLICRGYYVYDRLSGWLLSPASVLFCLLNLYLGIMYLLNLDAIRYAPGRLARELREGKNDLAWLYIETITTYHQPDPLPDLHFHFTNRRYGRVTAPLDTLIRLVNYFDARYPDISLGYDGKLARRFFFRPGSLKTQPVRHRMAKKTVHTIVSADY